jgi:hypothetical protein
VEPAELFDRLCQLAREAGFAVRPTQDRELASGACRVRGQIWIVLAPGDPVEERIRVVAGALAAHAADFLEGRYLPPAVRDCLRP